MLTKENTRLAKLYRIKKCGSSSFQKFKAEFERIVKEKGKKDGVG